LFQVILSVQVTRISYKKELNTYTTSVFVEEINKKEIM